MSKRKGTGANKLPKPQPAPPDSTVPKPRVDQRLRGTEHKKVGPGTHKKDEKK